MALSGKRNAYFLLRRMQILVVGKLEVTMSDRTLILGGLARPVRRGREVASFSVAPNAGPKMHRLLRWKLDFNIFLLIWKKDAETWPSFAGIAVTNC